MTQRNLPLKEKPKKGRKELLNKS
jgi:hypothetical protein